jgi:photosystem II stability/assembly factor-like uncharacterized protein
LTLRPASLEHSSANRFFVTDDAGTSWREISPLDTNDAPDSRPTVATVDVASTLYVATGGIMRRSSDWGETWSEPSALPSPPASLLDLQPTARGRLFARTDGDLAHSLWQSADGGTTWQAIAIPDADFALRLTPSSTPVVLVAETPGSVVATRDAGAHWQTGALTPVPDSLVESRVAPYPLWAPSLGLRSEDGGGSWQRLSVPGPGHFVPSSADPKSALWFGDTLLRSADGGSTWNPVELSPSLNQVHAAASCPPPSACVYALYSNTSSPFATALRRSNDNGKTWGEELPVPDALFYFPDALLVAPDDDQHLVGSGGMGLAETRDGGHTWTSQALPDMKGVASIAVLGHTRVVTSTARSRPPHDTLRSSDDGATWTEVEPFSGTLFTSPRRPDAIYLIATGVYRSDDQGLSWNLVSPAAWQDQGISVTALADTASGKLVATIENYGLVTFE